MMRVSLLRIRVQFLEQSVFDGLEEDLLNTQGTEVPSMGLHIRDQLLVQKGIEEVQLLQGREHREIVDLPELTPEVGLEVTEKDVLVEVLFVERGNGVGQEVTLR